MPIDPTKYPAHWKWISLYIRAVRAEWQCEWCGARQATQNPKTGSVVVLTVAHIDRDTTNNDYSNLAALCQKCHLDHDRESHQAAARKTFVRKRGLQDLFNIIDITEGDRS